jgi:cytoskeletal protein RodZ
MNEFVSSNIFHNREYIAQELRQTRTDKKISLEKAARQTGINQKYLSALESGNWQQLPAGIYGKKFLKEYAIYLGLDTKILLELYIEETSPSTSNQISRLFTRITPKLHYTFNLPKLIQTLAITAAVAVCLFYLGFYVTKIIAAPNLTLTQPTTNITTKASRIAISGQTEPNAEVKINNQTVLVQSDGKFTEMINLKTGLNIIVVSSQKKYSKTSEIIRQIFVEEH